MRKWRNWQTHQLEGLTVARPWGFESPLPHHQINNLQVRKFSEPGFPFWVLPRYRRHVASGVLVSDGRPNARPGAFECRSRSVLCSRRQTRCRGVRIKPVICIGANVGSSVVLGCLNFPIPIRPCQAEADVPQLFKRGSSRESDELPKQHYLGPTSLVNRLTQAPHRLPPPRFVASSCVECTPARLCAGPYARSNNQSDIPG